MEKSLWASSLVVLCFAAALILIGGCQEENCASGLSIVPAETAEATEVSIDTGDAKKFRLIAAENLKLKKQLDECKAECKKEIERQKSLLQEYKLKAESEKEAGDKLTEFLFTENLRLEEENKQLKEKLK